MTVATASLTLVAASSASAATVFGFQNQYAPSNWTLTNDSANGSVNTSGAPASISLTAGNNESSVQGTTSYTITAAASGTVKFDWSFSDPAAFANNFGYLLNGNFNFLSFTNGDSGTSTFNVSAGDSFGFRVVTTNTKGLGTGAISNFEAPAPTPTPVSVPESSSVLGLLALGGLGIGLKCRKRK
jgi:hypothetical protein